MFTEDRTYPKELVRTEDLKYTEIEFENKPVKVAYHTFNDEYRTNLYLVHGLGTSLNSWLYQFGELHRLPVRVVAVDLPGFGRSDKPTDASYTVSDFASALFSISQALDLPVHLLMGHSMGGQICLEYAARRPQFLKAMLLNAPAGFESFSALQRWQLRNFYNPAFYAVLAPYYYEFLVRRNFYNWREELRFMITERQKIMFDRDKFVPLLNTMQKCVLSMLDTASLKKRLGGIQAETWVVYGKQDYYIPNNMFHSQAATRRIMEQGASRIPGSKVIAVDDCGHKVHMDRPNEFNAILKEFITTYGTVGGSL